MLNSLEVTTHLTVKVIIVETSIFWHMRKCKHEPVISVGIESLWSVQLD